MWLARPVENVRRVFYYGYHNDDPAQVFRSSLPIGRVLEDPPGELPVLLCYKLNGEYPLGQAGRAGADARAGGLRLQVGQVAAAGGADQRLPGQRHLRPGQQRHRQPDEDLRPLRAGAGDGAGRGADPGHRPGPGGRLRPGQGAVLAAPADAPLPPDDPHFARAPWRDADILPPPDRWGGGLPDGRLPERRRSSSTRRPAARASGRCATPSPTGRAVLPGVAPGGYDLRCRTIDLNGIAQPLPRPFPKSGRAAIQQVSLVVEA